MKTGGKYQRTALVTRGAYLLFAFIFISLVAVSCGRGNNTVGAGSKPALRTHNTPPARAGLEPAPTTGNKRSLDSVLREIDAYPVPKGVSAQTWTMLVAELKKQLVARSKDGKTLSIAPVGTLSKVTNLAAAMNPAGTQATVTWTEALAGDCNNDGEVGIADLQPIAAHYGETSTGSGSPAYLADANGDGEVGITDLQPIAADYSMHVEGYEVWRGSYNGTSTDWETTFRPNVDNPANTSFSSDRTASPPATARPSYTYTDDVSGLTDKTNVRYRVCAYGDGAEGQESDEVIMPPPTNFNVSGTVTESSVGLAGVTMTLTPGGSTADTQADGTYIITNVPNGSYTLTPSKTDYSFTPATRAVTVSGANVTGQDFTANPVTYSVSGTVTVGGTGLAGVTMLLSPGGYVGTTQSDGTYTVTGVPNGIYALTPTLPGYVFTPFSLPITVAGADQTGVDFTGVAITVSGTVAMYGGAPMQGVVVTASPGGLNATTQADGTYTISAVPDGDYTLTATKTNCGFAPAGRPVTVASVDLTGQDFTGSAMKWSYLTGNTVKSFPVVGADGTIYVGSSDKNLYAFDPDGTKKWSVLVNDVVETAPCIGADGTIYFTSKDGRLYDLYDTGGVKWSYPAPDTTTSSPAVGADAAYFGTDDKNAYAINTADGTLKWTYPALSQVVGSTTVAPDGTIYIGDLFGTLYALNPDGTLKWQHMATSFLWNAPALAVDGTVYFTGLAGGKVYAVNPADGSEKWMHDFGGSMMMTGGCAVAADGTVYVVGSNAVYALNPLDGSVVWQHPASGMIGASPRVAPDGTVCIGTADYNLYGLSPSDGSVRWLFPTGADIESSPAFAADGTVYIGSDDYYVYAITP